MKGRDYIIRKTATISATALMFILCIVLNTSAEETKEKKGPEAIMKEVTGEVSAIDKHCIAVVYKHDPATGDYELPITIKDPPQMEHIKELNQIKMGDTVTVKYEQMTEIGEDGKEIIGDKFAKVITFLHAAPPPPPEKPETENPLDSENTEEQ